MRWGRDSDIHTCMHTHLKVIVQIIYLSIKVGKRRASLIRIQEWKLCYSNQMHKENQTKENTHKELDKINEKGKKEQIKCIKNILLC